MKIFTDHGANIQMFTDYEPNIKKNIGYGPADKDRCRHVLWLEQRQGSGAFCGSHGSPHRIIGASWKRCMALTPAVPPEMLWATHFNLISGL